MTRILASTAGHLVEYDPASGGCLAILTIARRTDGRAKGVVGKDAILGCNDFLDSLKTHAPEDVVRVFLYLLRRHEWQGFYRPASQPPGTC